jgi:rhamnulokinase
LQEALRSWGGPAVEGLLAEAAALPALRSVVDLDAPEFLPTGDMPARITAQCRATGQQPPARPAEFVRCIVDSLALAHRKAVRRAAELTGHRIEVVHMVGAGARNDLMCRLTADACGLPVIAGPVEATALGNALIQAGAFGVVKDLSEMRALVTATRPLRRHEPRTDERAWDRADARLRS